MPQLVKIPFASVDYTVTFAWPNLKLIADRAPTAQKIVDALLPYNFALKNLEVQSPSNPAEHKLIFRLPERAFSFQFGAESYSVTKDRADWPSVQQDMEIIEALEQAMSSVEKIDVKARTVTLAMHLQLLEAQRADIMAPFLPAGMRSFYQDKDVISHGVHVKWDRSSIMLDYSLAFANGIFVRIINDYAAETTLINMADDVRFTEAMVLGLLGVEEAYYV